MERFHLEKRKSLSGPDAEMGELKFDVEKPKEEPKVPEEITPDSSRVPENLEYSEADLENTKIIKKLETEASPGFKPPEKEDTASYDIYGERFNKNKIKKIIVVKKRVKTQREKDEAKIRAIRIAIGKDKYKQRKTGYENSDPTDPNL